MYDFYYGDIRPKYADRVKLAYTDTDSFIIHIFTKDFYTDVSSDVNEWFDTSCYSNKPLEVGVNKKKPGTMKDETGDNEMIESVNVCAKLYSYAEQTKELKKKRKQKVLKMC